MKAKEYTSSEGNNSVAGFASFIQMVCKRYIQYCGRASVKKKKKSNGEKKKNQFTHLLPVPVRASRAASQYVNAMNSLSLELSRPLLLTPESCVFPDTLFCDKWHLNLKGSEIYSEMIARAINGLPGVH